EEEEEEEDDEEEEEEKEEEKEGGRRRRRRSSRTRSPVGGPDPGAPRPSLGQGHPWQRQAAQGKKHTSEPENARRRAGHPGGGERSPSAAHSEGWREGGGPYRCPVSARVPSGPGRAARGGPAAARPASSQRSRRRRAAAPPRPATVICVSLSCSIHEHEPWPQRGFVRVYASFLSNRARL
ncbi:unnamed protein product, partial [Prorocentrum cordatum]